MKLIKPKRIEDKEYLEYIRKQECVINNGDCWGDMVAAHLKSVGSGGNDNTAIPMCVGHHTGGMGITKNLHNTPMAEFEKIYHINLWNKRDRLLEKWMLQQ